MNRCNATFEVSTFSLFPYLKPINLQFHFSSLPFFINKLYFWYSLVFLAARSTATILIASAVQLEARRPLELFRTIPSEGWNEELQRFFNHIKTETTALSGLDLFTMTRKLMLTLIGSLLVYEIVLLQFSSEDIDWDNLVDCAKAFPKLQ